MPIVRINWHPGSETRSMFDETPLQKQWEIVKKGVYLVVALGAASGVCIGTWYVMNQLAQK